MADGPMQIRKLGHSVTIKDIASHLNMAHSTVSRALNDRSHISSATKQRVKEAAEKLGYVANLSARMIRGDAGLLVGLIIPAALNELLWQAVPQNVKRRSLSRPEQPSRKA